MSTEQIDTVAQSPATSTTGRAPTLAEVAEQIVAPVLGLATIGADDDFFDHDATSLHMVQIAARVLQRYEVEVPLADLFDEPTAASLVRLIAHELAEG